MSIRRQQPDPRRVRRQRSGNLRLDTSRLELPGLLGFLTNKKLFMAMGVIFAGAIILSLFVGTINVNTDDGPVRQANELPDVPGDDQQSATGTVTPSAGETAATAVAKRYTAAPELTIDTSRRYTATLKTAKGDIQIELYPEAAPQAVNTFVFLAQDGYYTNTPFMQVTKNPDGSKFTAQAGDPTRTGLGTPGFTIREELTSRPFVKGAVGVDDGQFFISYGDYPALNGKYSIVGQVVSGLDVLDRLSLLDVTQRGATGGDLIQAVSVNPS